MPYQTNTNQTNVYNDQLEQDYGANTSYFNDQHHNKLNTNIIANSNLNYRHIQNHNKNRNN